MKIGSSDISAIYAGTDEVQKIMLGTDEVYSSAPPDWDTYKDGIYRQYWTNVYAKPYNNVYYFEVEIEAPVSFSSMNIGNTFIHANNSTGTRFRMYNPNGNLPFYILIWNTVNRTWHKCQRVAGYNNNTEIYYSVTPAMPDPATEPWEIHYLIWCTQDPGDITTFTDYDTQIPWETDANGIWRINSITYGSSDTVELIASTNGSGKGGVDWEWSYMGSTENCTGNFYNYRYYSKGSGNPTGSPNTATLVTYSLRDRQFTSASAGFCATARFYDARLSRSDYTAWPQVFILYDRLFEPEELYRLSTYDGPVANWDTYANGVYLLPQLDGSDVGMTAVPAYPTTTYDPAMDDTLNTWEPLANPNYPGIRTNYNTPAQNADSPPYIAVYIHEYHDAQDGYQHNAKGWYVFERPEIPNVNTGLLYTPYAWPGDTSSGSATSGNDEGYIARGGDDSSGYIVVFLDEYNDPVGAGGTDHWTKPPMVHFGTVDAVNTASNQIGVNWGTYLSLGSYIYSGMENGFDVGAYPYTPIRGTFYGATTGLFYNGLLSNIGMIDFELYTNGTKTHTGILDTSGYTSPAVQTSAITDVAYSDFDVYCNNVSIGDEIIAVYYYND